MYSVAKPSDGERNAIIMAAIVLTAPRTPLIPDEPERHPYRAIIAPLLKQLFGKGERTVHLSSRRTRMLPVLHGTAQTLLLRDCSHQNDNVVAWDVDLLAVVVFHR